MRPLRVRQDGIPSPKEVRAGRPLGRSGRRTQRPPRSAQQERGEVEVDLADAPPRRTAGQTQGLPSKPRLASSPGAGPDPRVEPSPRSQDPGPPCRPPFGQPGRPDLPPAGTTSPPSRPIPAHDVSPGSTAPRREGRPTPRPRGNRRTRPRPRGTRPRDREPRTAFRQVPECPGPCVSLSLRGCLAVSPLRLRSLFDDSPPSTQLTLSSHDGWRPLGLESFRARARVHESVPGDGREEVDWQPGSRALARLSLRTNIIDGPPETAVPTSPPFLGCRFAFVGWRPGPPSNTIRGVERRFLKYNARPRPKAQDLALPSFPRGSATTQIDNAKPRPPLSVCSGGV